MNLETGIPQTEILQDATPTLLPQPEILQEPHNYPPPSILTFSFFSFTTERTPVYFPK